MASTRDCAGGVASEVVEPQPMSRSCRPRCVISLTALIWAIVFQLSATVIAAAEPPHALMQQAIGTHRKDDFAQSVALATQAIKSALKQSQTWQNRAQLYASHGDHAKAVADYNEVIKLDPNNADAWQRRGEAYFKCGKFAESVSDFNKYLSLIPDQKPYHWQRGISLYYAGRFREGKQQFALHQTVNPHDVENAVWHFLCTARAEGMGAAKKQLIPIVNDARVPMAQVHRLFAGKATPQEVLAAAQAAPTNTRAGEPVFYANLYLGLFFEALGDGKKAREYILRAAERSKENGYMGDVARVHADILRKGKWKRGTAK
jgi:lipoprotein NlpI